MQFSSVMLGFNVREGTTGDVETQRNMRTTRQAVMFSCTYTNIEHQKLITKYGLGDKKNEIKFENDEDARLSSDVLQDGSRTKFKQILTRRQKLRVYGNQCDCPFYVRFQR